MSYVRQKTVGIQVEEDADRIYHSPDHSANHQLSQHCFFFCVRSTFLADRGRRIDRVNVFPCQLWRQWVKNGF